VTPELVAAVAEVVKAQQPPPTATPELVAAVAEALKAQQPSPELVAAVAEALKPPPPPPPDPLLISEGRVFNQNSTVVSSFDDEDVTNYSVTRSSFDDTDLINEHPTGP
jgi:hypothetical protein